MDYLDLTPSLVNQCFNTVTREGRDQIYFRDVTEVIGFLEEASHQKRPFPGDTGRLQDLELARDEIQFLQSNFEQLKESGTFKIFGEKLARLKDSVGDARSEREASGRRADFLGPETAQRVFQLLAEQPDELRKSIFEANEPRERVPLKGDSEARSFCFEKKGEQDTGGGAAVSKPFFGGNEYIK